MAPARLLSALAERPGDGVGRGAYPELGFQACEPRPNGVEAEEKLPGDLGFVFEDRSRAQHLGLARCQAEAVEGVRAEAGDPLLEQQCVGIAGEQADGKVPSVAVAVQRRARGARGPPRGPTPG